MRWCVEHKDYTSHMEAILWLPKSPPKSYTKTNVIFCILWCLCGWCYVITQGRKLLPKQKIIIVPKGSIMFTCYPNWDGNVWSGYTRLEAPPSSLREISFFSISVFVWQQKICGDACNGDDLGFQNVDYRLKDHRGRQIKTASDRYTTAADI